MEMITLKVQEIDELTPAIKKFVFQAVDGGSLPSFSAGAHIDFHLETGMIKSYSLANDPSETDRYVTAILREESGAGGSLYMHDQVHVGKELTITPPQNNFELAEQASQHILLAGGIGITPLLAMGYKLRDEKKDCYLHYCSKSVEETAFLDEVKTIFGNNLTLHHDGGDPANGINLADTFSAQPNGAHVYICGPSGLLNAARDATSHWREGSVHFELFTSAKTDEEKATLQSRAAEDDSFEIELAKSGKILEVPPDKSILQVLWENDIEVLHACEEGWCGNCVVEYLSGGVDHRDEVLDDVDRESKLQVCISRALPGEKIVLDL